MGGRERNSSEEGGGGGPTDGALRSCARLAFAHTYTGTERGGRCLPQIIQQRKGDPRMSLAGSTKAISWSPQH